MPAWERRGLPLVYPLAARIIDRYLDITTMAAKVHEFRAHPAGAHALKMFREERR